MVEALVLKAEKREQSGTTVARKLRAKGMIPAIIYGHKLPPVAVQLNRHDVALELQHHHRLLQVELDGKVDQLLVKDIQYDHLGEEILHVDLARVSLDERVQVMVPLEFRGTSAGEHEGGHMEHYQTEVEVECRAVAIPENIRVLVKDMQLGDVLHAGQLVLPEGCTLVTDPETAIAGVKAVGEAPEEEEAVEGEPGPSEPEVISERKEDEDASD